MTVLSDKVNSLGESKTLAMARLTNELKAKGADVVNLTLGEPDLTPFAFFKVAAKKAIDQNVCRYSPVSGYPALREAIAKKLKRDNDLHYKPEQIVASTGAKQVIANLMFSLMNTEDEVILPAPYWVSYFELIQFAGGTPRVIFAGSDQKFKITAKQLEESINSKTKAFLFSNPSNPTGAVYSDSELAELAQVFEKYPHVLIISDEIYEHIYYGKHLKSLGSFDSLRDRVITVNGLSKAFSVTGWRLGYVAAPLEIAKACEKIQSQFTSGPNVIAQMAAIEALNEDPQNLMPERNAIFKKRGEYVFEQLSTTKGFHLDKPEGAFYVFPNVEELFGKTFEGRLIESSQDVSMILLEKFFVGTTPGYAFGAEGYIRISYAASMEDLEKAMRRIKEFSDAIH